MSNPWAPQQQAQNPFGGQAQQQQPSWPQPGQQGGQPRGPQPPTLGDALAGGGAQAAFDQHTPVGVVIRGVVIDAKVQQTRHEPRFWDDGNPKWIIIIRIRDAEWSMNDQAFQPLRTSPDDDGTRAFYVKTWGDNFRKLQDAIKLAGHTDAEKALAPGTPFMSKHTGKQRSSRGGNDELLYDYRIGGGQQAAPPVQQVAQPVVETVGAPPPHPVQQTPAQPPQQQAAPWPQQQPMQEEPPF